MRHRQWEITIPPFLFLEESLHMWTWLSYYRKVTTSIAEPTARLPKRIQTPPYVAVFEELLLSYSDCKRRLHRCQSKPNPLSTNNNSRKYQKQQKNWGERSERKSESPNHVVSRSHSRPLRHPIPIRYVINGRRRLRWLTVGVRYHPRLRLPDGSAPEGRHWLRTRPKQRSIPSLFERFLQFRIGRVVPAQV